MNRYTGAIDLNVHPIEVRPFKVSSADQHDMEVHATIVFQLDRGRLFRCFQYTRLSGFLLTRFDNFIRAQINKRQSDDVIKEITEIRTQILEDMRKVEDKDNEDLKAWRTLNGYDAPPSAYFRSTQSRALGIHITDLLLQVERIGVLIPSEFEENKSSNELDILEDDTLEFSLQREATKLFISYRRADSRHIAGRIYDRLTQEFEPDKVFFDVDRIPIGVDFREYIVSAIEESAVVLAVIGPSWVNKEWTSTLRLFGSHEPDFVRVELEEALRANAKIMPITIDDTQVPNARLLPESLKDLAYLNAWPVRSGRDFKVDIDRIVIEIHKLLADKKSSALQS
jgi:hypothetical protein